MSDKKHPLEHKWTMWYDSRKTAVDTGRWEDNLQKVSDFAAVEDFWSIYNHIKRPNALEYGANYHVFKSGIKPMWEDEANKVGGRFILSGTKKDSDRLNDMWELLLLSMIGEYLEDEVTPLAGGVGHVTGAVLGRRKAGTKIAVWCRDSKADEALKQLESRLRSVLRLPADVNVTWEPHNK
eukprot:TRINITY_DN3653_c0_g1_i1.p2 TRINITY_DN3653_c0_g1~~TRINITY_DN3653_c0_g1_i1.p2  ORF type:complete len:181 (+),score=79.29 TRINITY_DN3653_c0_g1_i1:54-596(+)